ncbi:hypothetical protein N6E09_004523, partial [Salmonella enterica]|nr:hypothetical protein [Salmonella enterica]
MKQHTVPALGLLLSGCAVQGNSQPDVPADNVVDQMIAVNTQKVSFVQQQLIAALTPVLPAPSRPTPSVSSSKAMPQAPARKVAAVPPAAPSARWPALTMTGLRPAMPALAVSGQAPTLRQALAKIVPVGWTIHYDMGLKPEVRRPLTW